MDYIQNTISLVHSLHWRDNKKFHRFESFVHKLIINGLVKITNPQYHLDITGISEEDVDNPHDALICYECIN